MRFFAMWICVGWCAVAAGSATLTEDFSDNNYTVVPAWVVEQGQFAADGTDIGIYYGPFAGPGMLAFGTTNSPTIHLDFSNPLANAPVTIEFDLFQSYDAYPSAYGFSFNIMDTRSGQSYEIDAVLTTQYYGNDLGEWTGFSSWRSDGSLTGGVGGKSLLNGWRHVVIKFDPAAGVKMSYAGEVVSSFANFKNLARVDRLTLSSGGGIGWFVDNVRITFPTLNVLTNTFSDNNYTADPAWTVESGQCAADGSDIGIYYGAFAGPGMLAFAAGSRIHLDFPRAADAGPVTIEFDLFQSYDAYPSAYGFSFNIMDTRSGQSYEIDGALTTQYYGNDLGEWTGFSSWRSDGSLTGGVGGKSLLNGWRHVVIQFDPATGVEMSYGGDLVSTFVNFKNLTRIDRLTLASGETVSWFVDNVQITYPTIRVPFEVYPNRQKVAAPAGTASFTVVNGRSTSTPWAAEVVQGADWLTILAGTSGTDSGPITVRFTENPSSIVGRVGTIRITPPCSVGGPQEVTVVQARALPWESAVGRGHRILVSRGLQIEGIAFPEYNGGITPSTFAASKLSTVNIWNHVLNPQWVWLGAAPGDLPWSKVYYDAATPLTAQEVPFLPQIIRMQYYDEFFPDENGDLTRFLTDQAVLDTLQGLFAQNRVRYPNVLNQTNQWDTEHTYAELRTYVDYTQPDMLMFDSYDFKGNLTGGSPFNLYSALQKYRRVGLAGIGGAGAPGLPFGLYTQCFTGSFVNDHIVSQSEMYLNQFAAWAFGCKLVTAFVYTSVPEDASMQSLFFTGSGGDVTPTAKFYESAELNRQSRNLGPALVRLQSTDLRMIMGRHYVSRTWFEKYILGLPEWDANETPTEVVTGLNGVPYLRRVSGENLGTLNSGLPGDVVIGFFKPLHESFDGDQYTDEKYFMIVNGLTDANHTCYETRQSIRLDFDFGSSGITGLQKRSRETGLVEPVDLIPDGGSKYHYIFTLGGGTGELFKYNTRAPFVGEEAAAGPEPVAGDANHDNLVDVGDLGILAAHYGLTSGTAWEQGDFNLDGKVDVGDLGILAANYGRGISGGADYNADYAKVFGTAEPTAVEKNELQTQDSAGCNAVGLPLIAGVLWITLMFGDVSLSCRAQRSRLAKTTFKTLFRKERVE